MNLATASAVDLAAAVRTSQVSPVEIVDALLDRINEWEPYLNAFVVLDADGAREQARAAADAVVRGDELGPLHGVPVTVKNIMDTAGFATRRGARITPDTVATTDAPPVARLREAGAIVMGVTTTPERGWTAVGSSPLTGHTHTPWMPGRTSGGSSAGAGALAGAGCGPLHIGTDGAGSVRIPAAFCGAVGFKPTYARIPYVPVPNNGALSHVGPITRTVDDAALMYSVMSGPSLLDHTSLPGQPRADIEPGGLRGLRIAYSPDLGHARVDPDVTMVVEQSLAALVEAGATVDEVTPEWGPKGPDMERALWALAVLAYLPTDDAMAEQMDPGLVACVRDYEKFTARQAIDAQQRRFAYAVEVNTWFENQGFDLIVTPSVSVTAFDVGLQQPPHWPQHVWDWLVWAEFSYPFDLSHGPAISVPAGLTSEGLPVGLQIAGARLADDLVLRAGAAFLNQRPFTQLPSLPVG